MKNSLRISQLLAQKSSSAKFLKGKAQPPGIPNELEKSVSNNPHIARQGFMLRGDGGDAALQRSDPPPLSGLAPLL